MIFMTQPLEYFSGKVMSDAFEEHEYKVGIDCRTSTKLPLTGDINALVVDDLEGLVKFLANLHKA